MPTTKSAKKSLRKSLEVRAKNRSAKSDLKTQLKKVRAAITAGDHTLAETEFRIAARKLDRAGAKHVIHANVASRTKSRLQHLMKVAKDTKAATPAS